MSNLNVCNELVENAIKLLIKLPSTYKQIEDTDVSLTEIRQSFPDYKINLLTTPRANDKYVDNELIILTNDGFVLKISISKDIGEPWIVSTAENWVSDTLLSVESERLSFHSCILYLDNLFEDTKNNLKEILENRLLIQSEIKKTELQITNQDLKLAENIFRTENQLKSIDSMKKWLTKKGLSFTDFKSLLRLNLEIAFFKDKICNENKQLWLSKNKNLKMATLLTVKFLTEDVNEDLTIAKSINVETEKKSGESCFFLIIPSTIFTNKLISFEIKTILESEIDQAIEFHNNNNITPELNKWFRNHNTLMQERSYSKILCISFIDDLNKDTESIINELIFEDWISNLRKEIKVNWHWL